MTIRYNQPSCNLYMFVCCKLAATHIAAHKLFLGLVCLLSAKPTAKTLIHFGSLGLDSVLDPQGLFVQDRCKELGLHNQPEEEKPMNIAYNLQGQ